MSGVDSLVLFNDFAVSEWMRLLLPLAMERRVCIITNMGASKRLIHFIMQFAYHFLIILTVGLFDLTLCSLNLIYLFPGKWIPVVPKKRF